MARFVAGSARRDITPSAPLYMGGFGQRTAENSGVRDPVAVKAVYLGSAHDELLLITLDLIHVPTSLGQAIRHAITRRSQLSRDRICIAASHTHSGPDVRPRDDRHRRYLADLSAVAVSVALEAVATARPAGMISGVGSAEFVRNRRTRGNPNVVDQRVPVFMFVERDSSAPIAIVFGCGCHPVTLGWENMEISADYPGCAQAAIERAFPGAVALFLNLASGDVIPQARPNADALDPRGYACALYDQATSFGEQIAAEAVRVIAQAGWVSDPQPVSVTRECCVADAYLGAGAALRAGAHSGSANPNRAGWSAEELKEQLEREANTIRDFLDVLSTGAPGKVPFESATLWADASDVVIRRELSEAEMRRLMAAVCRYRLMSSRLASAAVREHVVPVQVMRLGDYRLAALPGEPLVEVARDWQRRCASEKAFVIGYANAHFQYLPHRSHFEEANWWEKYETMANDLAPDATEILLETAEQLCLVTGL